MKSCVRYPCQIFFALNADYIPIWLCFQKVMIFTFYSVMLQDRNLKPTQSFDITRIMIFFDILIVIGVIYVGYFIWDFVRSRYHLIEHPCWKWKWMKKPQTFPIPLPRCAMHSLLFSFLLWLVWFMLDISFGILWYLDTIF